jgi:hypothetical protein
LLELILQLDYKLEILFKPQGTIYNPAKTCKDLFMDHPLKSSGFYFIDLNGFGETNSTTFNVYCHKTTMATCLNQSNQLNSHLIRRLEDSSDQWCIEPDECKRITLLKFNNSIEFSCYS